MMARVFLGGAPMATAFSRRSSLTVEQEIRLAQNGACSHGREAIADAVDIRSQYP